ncbi:MAG TPA: MMPL family transporter, partial [Spirochaetia bacterium]|nr:MMPL family transporter [Spirochaetia bacterium]
MPESKMHKLLAFSQRHSVAVIVVTGLLTIFFGYFALQIKLNSDIESLLPPNDSVAKLMQKYGDGLPKGDYLVVAAKAKGGMSLVGLAALNKAIGQIEKLPGVHPAIDPFSYYTFKMIGRRITVVPLSGADPVPRTAAELKTFEQNLKDDPFAKDLIVSSDGTALASLFLVGKVPDDRKFVADLKGILATLTPYYTTYYTGATPFSVRTRDYLLQDLPKLFLLAALVILIMYYVGFRAKRAVFLPLAVVTLGTVWCLGLMTLLGFQLTVVSIITPPLVLTLGSSYSIHILNQYYREAKQNPGQRTEIINSIDHVNRTIILAAATTVFGFLSLLPASMYQLREFGVATSFGILSCAVLSLFFFPAVLSHLRVPKSFQSNKVLEGFLARTMGHLSRFVLRFRIAILCVLGLIIIAFGFSLSHIRYQ